LPSEPSTTPGRTAWTLLLALTAAFALSQAFRTMAAIMAPPLQRELGLSPQQLGIFAGTFHFAFASLQLFMGMGIDVWGPRRTVLAVFPLATIGSLLAATAQGWGQLLLGQAVIGVGCAPAFLVCTVHIARRFGPERFASVSGLTLGLGSVGLLLTGTPLAWVIEQWSWRAGFLLLAALSAAAWLAILLVRDRDAPPSAGERPTMVQALRGYGELFRLRHTWGIVVLALVSYGSFLTLRGLWLGPLLVERHGFTLVATGHVALLVSVVGMFGPPLFGRLDPGDRYRRRLIAASHLSVAAMYLVMAFSRSAVLDVALSTAASLVAGCIVLQYADVRAAYPAAMTGRAMAVYTMATFLGVGWVQWFTGAVAQAAPALGAERYSLVLATLGAVLAAGVAGFRFLPRPGAGATTS
jgi:predicted MFS family arabinose efflux permease